MRLVVTGPVEIGKTTVLRMLLPRLRRQGFQLGGVLTTTDARGGKWVQDLQTRQRRLLGPRRPMGDVDVGRYGFRSEAMAFANRAIAQAQASGLLIVDELGSLELKGQGFVSALEALSGRGKKPALLVIRQKLLTEYAALLGPFDDIFTVTEANRDRLHCSIHHALMD